jgi:hypothetical protein
LERLQEEIMQANLESGKAVSDARRVGPIVAFLAGVSLVTTLALCAPEKALAATACGATHPGGVHAAGTGSGGVHAATAKPPTSGGGSGGGGGTLGCANGSSASALHGLPITSSGRVAEGGNHGTHIATHTRTATTNTGAHLRGVKPPHA